MEEAHVYEDIPSSATAEHARHVIEITEAAFKAAKTSQTQTLTATFAQSNGASASYCPSGSAGAGTVVYPR